MILISGPNSPNFLPERFEDTVNALAKQNCQTFHPNGHRIDPDGRKTKVDSYGAKLSSPHRGPKVVPPVVVKVVSPKTLLVKVDPNPTMAPTVEIPTEPVPLVGEQFKAQEQERRARLTALKVEQLKVLAREAAIQGRSKLVKAGLVNALMTQTLKG